MATVTEITQVLGQVQQLSAGMLEELEKGTAEVGVFGAKSQQLGKVITGISGIVPMTIYSSYQEFFDSFKDFCEKCKEEDFLIENVDNMASSLELFGECLSAIAEECIKKIKICACCGNEVVYKPLPSYYEDMKKMVGDYQESCPETLNKEEYLCPACNSSDRDRLIVSFLKELEINQAVPGERLLQIAPARTIEHWIHGNCTRLTYHSTDLFMDVVTFQSDIQDMKPVEDGYYDYFICSHVLEHVQDDRKAMHELHRILKDDGLGLFLVPLNLDVERLQEAGFYIHELGKQYFGEEVFHQCGLTDTSLLYVLTKTDVSVEALIEEKKKRRENFVASQPLVSVILPCYNHAEYVGEAIESVLNQTYKNIEFLIADDGSTDGTQDVVKRYENRLAQLHLFSENRGGGLGTFLAQRAKGKYIAMMHSDDVWALSKIEMQVAYMESHPECGACFTGGACVTESGKDTGYTYFQQINMPREQWIRYFYENGNCLAHPSIMARTEIYAALPGKTTSAMFRQVPDFWMWLNLLCEHEIHVIERNLLYFRMHESGSNQNTSARTQENRMRHLVEESYIWYTYFKNMDSETFRKAFRSRMVHKDATTEEEIMCEKLLVLLEPRAHYFKQAALYYMYDICQIPNVFTLLQEQYGFSKKDMARVSGELLN